MRVAVVGARGIGKHHAKWFSRAGCEVAAIYGTQPESAEAAAAAIRELVPFTGRVFSDWDRFLAEGDFTAASVCSPAEAHQDNVVALARAGKHVLCEKPLAWHWESRPEAIVQEAREMLAAAREAGVILAVNAQYPAALPAFRQLHREVLGEEAEFPRLSYFMETKGKPRSPHGPAEVWVDLAPHPLAFLDAAVPGGSVRWHTLEEDGEGLEARVGFDWVAGERVVPIDMTLRRVPGGTPVRRVSNGRLECDYEGRTVDGEFGAVLRAEGHEWVGRDFMRTSVEQFVDAVRAGDEKRALVTGAAGLRQLEILVGVWARCWGAEG
jgi:predicted dehydrogenase